MHTYTFMNGNCALCGTAFPYLQRDHIKPRHLGGGNEAENIQFICPNCHAIKSHDEIVTRGMSLETRAKVSAALKGRALSPTHKNRLAFAATGKSPFKGHHHSDEAKAKLSAGQRNYALGRKFGQLFVS